MITLLKAATVAAALVVSAPAFAQFYGSGYGYVDPGYGYDYGPGPDVYVERPAPAAPVIEGRSVEVGPSVSVTGVPSVAWCESHYRSYDPASQTYLGYDGVRHSCP